MQLPVSMSSVCVPGLLNEPGRLGLFSPQRAPGVVGGRQLRQNPGRCEFEPGLCDLCGPPCPHLWGWRKALRLDSFEMRWEELQLQAQNLAMEAFT